MPFDSSPSSSSPATCCRIATIGHAGRDRIPSQHADQSRGRHRSRAVPRRAGARPRGHARHGVAGPDRRLRAVPQPQVRSRSAQKEYYQLFGVLQNAEESEHRRAAAGRDRSVPGSAPEYDRKRERAARRSTSSAMQAEWEENRACGSASETGRGPRVGLSLTRVHAAVVRRRRKVLFLDAGGRSAVKREQERMIDCFVGSCGPDFKPH